MRTIIDYGITVSAAKTTAMTVIDLLALASEFQSPIMHRLLPPAG